MRFKILLLILFVIYLTNCVLKIKDCHCLSKQEKIETFESTKLDKKPEFPGGDSELLKYVAEKSRFSEPDSLDDLQSSFYARFVIDTIGKVRNICILRPQDPERLTKTEKEFLETLANMPVWKPAEKNGKKVAVWFIIPLKIHWQY